MRMWTGQSSCPSIRVRYITGSWPTSCRSPPSRRRRLVHMYAIKVLPARAEDRAACGSHAPRLPPTVCAARTRTLRPNCRAPRKPPPSIPHLNPSRRAGRSFGPSARQSAPSNALSIACHPSSQRPRGLRYSGSSPRPNCAATRQRPDGSACRPRLCPRGAVASLMIPPSGAGQAAARRHGVRLPSATSLRKALHPPWPPSYTYKHWQTRSACLSALIAAPTRAPRSRRCQRAGAGTQSLIQHRRLRLIPVRTHPHPSSFPNFFRSPPRRPHAAPHTAMPPDAGQSFPSSTSIPSHRVRAEPYLSASRIGCTTYGGFSRNHRPAASNARCGREQLAVAVSSQSAQQLQESHSVIESRQPRPPKLSVVIKKRNVSRIG
jgi:hypothetical protein